MRELVEELRGHLAVVRRGGSEAARTKHTDHGKLLVRDRIDRLLDPGSPFLESAASLASWVVSRQIQPSTFSAWQRHLAAPPVAKTASTSSAAVWLAGSQVNSGMPQPKADWRRIVAVEPLRARSL